MSDKPQRQPQISYIGRCNCTTCGAEYFISEWAKIADTGRCISCDKEISDLEAMFNPAVTS